MDVFLGARLDLFWPLTLSHSDHDRLVLPIAIAVTQSAHVQPQTLQISDIVSFFALLEIRDNL